MHGRGLEHLTSKCCLCSYGTHLLTISSKPLHNEGILNGQLKLTGFATSGVVECLIPKLCYVMEICEQQNSDSRILFLSHESPNQQVVHREVDRQEYRYILGQCSGIELLILNLCFSLLSYANNKLFFKPKATRFT